MKLIRKAIDAMQARADEARARTRARDLARKPHVVCLGRAGYSEFWVCIGPDREYAVGLSKEAAFASWKGGNALPLIRSPYIREALARRRVRRFQP
jgi:hypothetical protein